MSRAQADLFEWKPVGEWKPNPVLPDLSRFRGLSLDCETDGLDKFKSLPVGIAIKTPDGNRQYIPFGHKGGGNLDPATVRRWAQRELRDKRIVNLNTGTDAEWLCNWGVDLEAQGCTLHDVAHSAALLNEYRRSGLNVDSLSKEYLQREKLGGDLDKSKIADMHSSMVGPYAEEDADLTYDIDEQQQPMIAAEGLERVQDLEDKLIYVNNHIERNGARLDLPKLQQWRDDVRCEMGNTLLELRKSSALPFGFSPNSSKKWAALFGNLGLEAHFAEDDDGDMKESYDAAFLKTVKDPIVTAAFRAKKLQSLLSKYLDKYATKRNLKTGQKFMIGDILRFHLYQLRGDEEGTISGRYSSANVNIQQVMKVAKQTKEIGPDWIIRELFIPDDGFDFFSGDASQIEFRLFTHYSKDAELIRAYSEDPTTDFYNAVGSITGQCRDDSKITSLGKLYGMGIDKLAGWLGLNCTCGVNFDCTCDLRAQGWQHEYPCGRVAESHTDECPAVRAIGIAATYDEKFPAAKRLAKATSKTARTRGYVFDLLGQRHRFPPAMMHKIHSSLNRVIQGSAAKIFKLKLLQLYDNRKTIGIHKLRMPAHDEATGDVDKDPRAHERLQECFNEVTIPLKVPVLWSLGFGANWRQCK